MKSFLSILLLNVLVSHTLVAQQPSLVVKVDRPLAPIQPTMWGIFFEDINLAADGGLYAELIKNRSFEFSQPLMGWKEHESDPFSMNKESGYTLVINRGEEMPNPRFARVNINANKGYGLTNEGFRGMGIKKDMQYNLSLWARQVEGNTTMLFQLVDNNGKVLGETSVKPSGNSWNQYKVTLKASATEPKGKLNILFEGEGVIDMDMISLFPNDTWKNRSNGLRADLVQLLADLKPGFLRFPGGCIVEGRDLSTRYQWKKTIGKIEDREMIINRWNTEFKHRLTPDYFQTFGLGFFEYFQLAEDLEAEPLPILSCGMACQFNTAEVVPMDQLDPYIEDALDLIEFANGPVSSVWGKKRADMGHEKPFNLKYIGVGNEQWGAQYIERYREFVKAIKANYPDMIIVTGSGPFPDGELFDYAHKELHALNAEIIDEHYYRAPEWFRENATRYDSYDRKGPKIFAGEYAAQSVAIASQENKNNWSCAMSEAAFMTGLERNADIVYMSSYAPLFAHVEGWQWTPDLIWFDNLSSYGTPNYYVQKLFATNRGTHVLSMTMQAMPVTGQEQLFATAVLDKDRNEVIIKIVNTSGKAQRKEIILEGMKKLKPAADLITLTSEDLATTNSIAEPEKVSPKQEAIPVKGRKITLSLAAYSLSIVRVKM